MKTSQTILILFATLHSFAGMNEKVYEKQKFLKRFEVISFVGADEPSQTKPKKPLKRNNTLEKVESLMSHVFLFLQCIAFAGQKREKLLLCLKDSMFLSKLLTPVREAHRITCVCDSLSLLQICLEQF